MSSDGDLALRIFLPCYIVAYMLVGGPLAVLAFRKKYGFDPVAVKKPDPLMVLGESYRNVLFATALAIVAVNAGRPSLLAYLAPFPHLHTPLVQAGGVAILLASLVLVRTAQLHLKSSWRFGCDRGAAPTPLITSGLYARSRNPIYVGMALTGVGLFLALPNALTFAIANLTFLLLQVRVRVEEGYLLDLHGEDFRAYCRRTPRWLFLRGRGR